MLFRRLVIRPDRGDWTVTSEGMWARPHPFPSVHLGLAPETCIPYRNSTCGRESPYELERVSVFQPKEVRERGHPFYLVPEQSCPADDRRLLAVIDAPDVDWRGELACEGIYGVSIPAPDGQCSRCGQPVTDGKHAPKGAVSPRQELEDQTLFLTQGMTYPEGRPRHPTWMVILFRWVWIRIHFIEPRRTVRFLWWNGEEVKLSTNPPEHSSRRDPKKPTLVDYEGVQGRIL